MDTEIFSSSTRMVTPSSAHHLVSSSGQPVSTQLDRVLTTSGLTKVQTEEIFLLTHEVQTLHGEASSRLHSVVPSRGAILYRSSGCRV